MTWPNHIRSLCDEKYTKVLIWPVGHVLDTLDLSHLEFDTLDLGHLEFDTLDLRHVDVAGIARSELSTGAEDTLGYSLE